MGLGLALKAFFKAFRDPKGARQFLEEQPSEEEPSKQEDHSHLRLLALLQSSGRLVDFLREDISGFNDQQVGAAARKIHADCAATLEECVTIRPLFEESEGSKITIPVGYDPNVVKIVGQVKGDPPYTGTLMHQGWKAHKRSLPKKVGGTQSEVIFPAEVEIR